MKTNAKTWAVWGLALLGLAAAGSAQAAGTARLNINVTISANLSVSINGAASSTQTASWNTTTANAKLVSPSSSTVLNDSGAQTEKWALSTNANSINAAGNAAVWSLGSSSVTVGADTFAVQAVFGSSNTAAGGCLAGAAATWDDGVTAPLLTSSPVTYTSTVFAAAALNNDGTYQPDVTAGGGNGRMVAGNKRALCWRVVSPDSTSTLDTQNIQVTVTAQNP
jgi:hypothetical protein